MKFYSDDPEFSFEALRNVGYAVSCGADPGELIATMNRITAGDYESWFREFNGTAQRTRQIADLALKNGRTVSAREALLKASTYYRMAEFFVRMRHADRPDVAAAYQGSVDAFAQAAQLTPGWERVEVPYDNTTLAGYVFKPAGATGRLPVLIFNGGFDSTLEELWFAGGDAATKRGYLVLCVDAPGQGRAIRQQHLPFRMDWEHVVTQLVDYLRGRPDVDPDNIALEGFSFGGWLAARAACFEPRLKALVQYNAVYDFGQGTLAQAGPEATKAWQAGDTAAVDRIVNDIVDKNTNPSFRWVIQQGMWTFGCATPHEYVKATQPYTLDGIVDKITMPVLLLDAEADGFFGNPPQPVKMWNALKHAPKTLVFFSKVEGAEEHCQAGTYLLNAQRTYDWLDHQLQGAPEPAYPEGVAQSARPGDTATVQIGNYRESRPGVRAA